MPCPLWQATAQVSRLCTLIEGEIMTSGVYILILKLEMTGSYAIGKLGSQDFPAGFYCYVGSALNNLEARIERHLRQEKKLHWHIDYLLQHARITDIVYAEIPKNKKPSGKPLTTECRLARHLAKSLAEIKGFGCSDCRCSSHLFYTEKAGVLADKTTEAFSKANLMELNLIP